MTTFSTAQQIYLSIALINLQKTIIVKNALLGTEIIFNLVYSSHWGNTSLKHSKPSNSNIYKMYQILFTRDLMSNINYLQQYTTLTNLFDNFYE